MFFTSDFPGPTTIFIPIFDGYPYEESVSSNRLQHGMQIAELNCRESTNSFGNPMRLRDEIRFEVSESDRQCKFFIKLSAE